MITAQASSLGHLHQAFSLDQTLSFYAHEQESCLANLMAWWWRLMVQKIVVPHRHRPNHFVSVAVTTLSTDDLDQLPLGIRAKLSRRSSWSAYSKIKEEFNLK